MQIFIYALTDRTYATDGQTDRCKGKY